MGDQMGQFVEKCAMQLPGIVPQARIQKNGSRIDLCNACRGAQALVPLHGYGGGQVMQPEGSGEFACFTLQYGYKISCSGCSRGKCVAG